MNGWRDKDRHIDKEKDGQRDDQTNRQKNDETDKHVIHPLPEAAIKSRCRNTIIIGVICCFVTYESLPYFLPSLKRNNQKSLQGV